MTSTENNSEKPKSVASYKMRPALNETFKEKKIKELIQEILTDKLQGKTYNVNEASKWSSEISDAVSHAVKDTAMVRYKHVVQVVIGQQIGAGCRYIAKCCWDAECDSYTSDVFNNASLFCVCTVFGIYLY